jgi:hypothetical protein
MSRADLTARETTMNSNLDSQMLVAKSLLRELASEYLELEGIDSLVEEHDPLSSWLASQDADEDDMHGRDVDFDMIVEEYDDPLSSWLFSKEASPRECDSDEDVFDESDNGFSSL